jgi:hypothetical protein
MKTNNLDHICLERLNNMLSRFDLKIVIVKISSLNVNQYRLIYETYNEAWIGMWKSISDMMFKPTNSIFECLESYYDACLSIQQYQSISPSMVYISCYNAYQTIKHLKSSSLEEFLVKCDLYVQ